MATKPKKNPVLNPVRPKANPALAVASKPKTANVTGAGEAKLSARRAMQKNPLTYGSGLGTSSEKYAARSTGAAGQLAADKLMDTARKTRKGK